MTPLLVARRRPACVAWRVGLYVRSGRKRHRITGSQPAISEGLASLLNQGARGPRAAPPRALQALPQGLVEDRRRGGGDVQRVEAAAHRQADRRVAEGAGALAEAALLAAEAEDHLAGEVELPGRLAGGIAAVGPEALLL